MVECHKKLYEEALVKEIMVSTALCVQELLQENNTISEEQICMFLEENYTSIIEEALNMNAEEDGDDSSARSEE